jgi:Tfp pilus assembly protein FimT
MPDRSSLHRGQTLTELLAMLGIAAVIAAAAVPVFSNLLLESRMNAAGLDGDACRSTSRASFPQHAAKRFDFAGAKTSVNAQAGWTGRAGSCWPADGDRFHQSLMLSDGSGTTSIRSNRTTISFEGGSGFATPATLTVCDRRGARAARACDRESKWSAAHE